MSETGQSKKIKRSVAVLVRNDGNILTVRRRDDDDELPGIWGLPAGTYRQGETLDTLVERIGRDRLGVGFKLLNVLVHGTQDRANYRLEMDLVEAAMDGLPFQTEWRWDLPDALKSGQEQGSLCCDLALGV